MRVATRRRGVSLVVLATLAAGGLVGAALPAAAGTGTTQRVNLANDGAQANNQSNSPSLSRDGRFVAFTSRANNLVPGDNDFGYDVFVRDREKGPVTLVSRTSGGSQVPADSFAPSISASGRYVAFLSKAAYLVPNDTNGVADGFVHDRRTGRTTLVSVRSGGGQGGRATSGIGISDDGRTVAFETSSGNLVAGDTNQSDDVFLRDLDAETTKRMSVDANGDQFAGHSSLSAISGDGLTVAFTARSRACNGYNTIAGFAHSVGAQTDLFACTYRDNDELTATTLSGDGRYVAYHAFEHYDLGDQTSGYVYDRSQRRQVSGCVGPMDLSSDGTVLACTQNGQVYVGQPGQASELVTESPACSVESGDQAVISGDGKVVAYTSSADSLVAEDTNRVDDIFVYLRGVLREGDGRLIRAAPRSETPALDGTGGRLAFSSAKRQVVDGDTNGESDVFLRSRRGEFRRLSEHSNGAQANGPSTAPSISADGRFVTFVSDASNLVDDDTNGVADVFLRNRFNGKTTRVSTDASGAQANGASTRAKISDNREFAVFESTASNLVADDTNGVRNVFRKNLRSGEITRISGLLPFGDDSPYLATVGDVGNDGSVAFNANKRGYVRAADGTIEQVRPIDYERETVTATSMSADGRYVAYRYTYELYYKESVIEGGTYIHDREGGRDLKVDGTFYKPALDDAQLSADGSAIAIPNGRDVRLVSGLLPAGSKSVRVSASDTCADANGASYWPAISGNGKVVSYTSDASNLVRRDRNGDRDVYRYKVD